MTTIAAFIQTVNDYASRGIPFLFVVDFEMEQPRVFPLSDVPENVLYDVQGRTNAVATAGPRAAVTLRKYPMPFEAYREKFDRVRNRLCYGDSYLANLTIRTEVRASRSLAEIFDQCRAKYKLLMDDRFLVFSPETFVRIEDGRILSHPMKGTIDAAVPGAAEVILADAKELAEHVTIVDLIRNDLSTVADNVQVTRFRYLDEVRTSEKTLLQVSSEICGVLPKDYRARLGDILAQLLPAGSVSGAPKRRTLEIIREAEGEPRGYYTGVFGIFDGDVLDSAVMIRYLEKVGGIYYYRSGGGITAQSDAMKEYQEAIDKVYVPVN